MLSFTPSSRSYRWDCPEMTPHCSLAAVWVVQIGSQRLQSGEGTACRESKRVLEYDYQQEVEDGMPARAACILVEVLLNEPAVYEGPEEWWGECGLVPVGQCCISALDGCWSFAIRKSMEYICLRFTRLVGSTYCLPLESSPKLGKTTYRAPAWLFVVLAWSTTRFYMAQKELRCTCVPVLQNLYSNCKLRRVNWGRIWFW